MMGKSVLNMRKISFGRRIGCLVYDSVALTAILFFATFIPTLIAGDAIKPENIFLTSYLTLAALAYYTICWRRGKTLGMLAWGVTIVTSSGHYPNTTACFIRFITAWASSILLGAGYLYSLLDTNNSTWHDKLSGTYLVIVKA
jgi:uncharacterized RDD family membrane protein YckC